MATYRKRNGKWQARITRKGQMPVSKTFLIKADAKRWARNIETEMDRGFLNDPKLVQRIVAADLAKTA